jgi:hypothetical protein
MFSDDRPELLDNSRAFFTRWIDQKGIKLEVPYSGTVGDESERVTVTPASEEGVSVLRLRLDEEGGQERWSTILTAIESGDERSIWVDLERVSEDAYGRPPQLAPPRLIRAFLASGSCRVGELRLPNGPTVIDEPGVSELVKRLLDPERIVPIVVVSHDRWDEQGARGRGSELAGVLAGVAPVWVLEGTATSALSKALGSQLHVFGGAARTYLPGLTVPDPFPRRHRFVSRDRFLPHPRAGAQLLARDIVRQAVAARPPLVFRQRVAKMSGFVRHAGDDAELLLAQLIEAEEERDRLKEDLGLAILESQEHAGDAAEASRRIKFLEQRLAEKGDPVYGTETPEAVLPESAASNEQALELAELHLHNLAIGDTISSSLELDQHPKAATWGGKAWKSLQALNTYAEARRKGSCQSDFRLFCDVGNAGIPSAWVVMKESTTTNNNERFRSARTFPVPNEVNPAGCIYMDCHIRLEKGSDPAPRIHFHDDTAGTGKVFVGYLGRHLPSKQTN